MTNYEKYERDGMVAVLYSPSYGSGWYSWNSSEEALLFDREIVEAVLVKDYASALKIVRRKYPEAYCGGINDLTIRWIPKGTQFEIDEYDGAESIHVIDDHTYITA